MREIVLDTETTGLKPAEGDRVVEIACVELRDHVPTGRHFQCYLNPERDMPAEAFAVHGLSGEFLKQHPLFAATADAFLDFIADAALVVHNAAFDIGFLNAELERIGRPALTLSRCVDTMLLARQKFPGARASLDALIDRFGIDSGTRVKHGALIDAKLLAAVYLELVGGRQTDLSLTIERSRLSSRASERTVRAHRPHGPSAAELSAHEAFLVNIKAPIWRD
jgi:DNA polymerase-3 subunit epsilon